MTAPPIHPQIAPNDPAAAYIDAALALHGVALTEEQRSRVIAAFRLNLEIAAPLLDYRSAGGLAAHIDDHLEIAPVFTP